VEHENWIFVEHENINLLTPTFQHNHVNNIYHYYQYKENAYLV